MKPERITTSLIGEESVAQRWTEIEESIYKLKKQIQQLEKEQKPLEERLKDLMKDADYGTCKGYSVEYVRSQAHRLNNKKLQAEMPEVYEKYYEAAERRNFRIKRTEPAKEEFGFEF